MKLKLEKPLAVFDVESTGINKRTDRIIELAIIKLCPDGKRETHEYLFNPERPIPTEATAIHGITNEDVKDCPKFSEKAREVAALLADCDLGGYNILGYDIPILQEEFTRAGLSFNVESRRIFDAQRVFHKKVPRDLTAALQFYCGELHVNAHGALGDVEATISVMEGELERYPDLPRDLDGLDAFCNTRDPSWLDRTGKFKWQDGEIVLNFGRYGGRKLKTLAAEEPNFLRWMLKADFPQDTREIVERAMRGQFPEPPKVAATEG